MNDPWKEVSDRVKHWYHEHQFVTYGKAFEWWLDASWEQKSAIAGNTYGKHSSFMDEIIHLTSCFGPQAKIELPPKPKGKFSPLKAGSPPKSVSATEIKKRKKGH